MPLYDVLVVGAGTAGCIAAKTAAQEGLSVLLVDRKSEKEVGEKVCGDAIGKHYFDKLGLDYPSGDELKLVVKGFHIISPDKKTRFKLPLEISPEGFIIDRRLFGQRLLNEAVGAGAEFEDRTLAKEPLVKDGSVIGSMIKKLDTKDERPVHARVTIDATGFNAVLRKKIPTEMLPERDVSGEDVQAGYREIRTVNKELEPYCHFYLNQVVSPGGYMWIFPRRDRAVNVGLGIQMKKGFPNPKKQLYKHVLTDPMFKGSKVLAKGAWFVPTRRPIDCMTANGLMLVGDAACLTNPMTGGGIGPSMLSGKLATVVAADAISKGDVSKEGLWGYNGKFMLEYGAKQAALDVFRMFLQRLGDEGLNFGMSRRIVKEEDVIKTSSDGHLRIGVSDKMLRALRGIGKPSLLSKLSKIARLMREARSLYENYPPPSDFAEWRSKVSEVMNALDRIFG